MTVRTVCGALTAAVLICGANAAAPAYAQARDGSILPPGASGTVTVAGCLALGSQTGGDRFVLASPTIGPIASVPDGSCAAAIDERALELEDGDDVGIDESFLGRWVEVSGKLEREMSTDLSNLRELDVASFRLVPVVPPAVAEVAPPPPIEQPAAVEEVPVATSGELPAALPQTASPMVALGAFGLLSLVGSLALRRYRAPRTR